MWANRLRYLLQPAVLAAFVLPESPPDALLPEELSEPLELEAALALPVPLLPSELDEAESEPPSDVPAPECEAGAELLWA